MVIPKMLIKRWSYSKILSSIRNYSKQSNPFVKTWNILSQDVNALFGKKPAVIYPEHADIVIIGGGFIGSSAAYWLKTRAAHGLSVVVLEKDLTYTEAQTKKSLGIIHQHFTLPENIYLSQYSAEFLRNIRQHLYNGVDIKFYPNGYLVLASEKYAQKLEENVTLQKEYGVKNELLTCDAINKRYPWINTHDVKLGCLGSECEGIMNMWPVLKGLVQKSQELGAVYVNAEVIGFELEKQRDVLMEGVAPGTFERINRVVYRTPDKQEFSIKFAICILAAGHKSGQIAQLAKIGTANGLLTIPLPIEQREHDIYSIKYNTGLNTPCIMDSSGLWMQKNGLENNLIGGHVPSISNEGNRIDEHYGQTIIESTLLNRILDCKNVDVSIVTTLINGKIES